MQVLEKKKKVFTGRKSTGWRQMSVVSGKSEYYDDVFRASKFFDASFAGRASISACEQVTTDAIAKSESLKCYAVTPIVGAVITPVRRSVCLITFNEIVYLL